MQHGMRHLRSAECKCSLFYISFRTSICVGVQNACLGHSPSLDLLFGFCILFFSAGYKYNHHTPLPLFPEPMALVDLHVSSSCISGFRCRVSEPSMDFIYNLIIGVEKLLHEIPPDCLFPSPLPPKEKEEGEGDVVIYRLPR